MSTLSSLKILDFSTLLPGPFGTLILADLGAQILRVEAPNRFDLSREVGAKDGDTAFAHRYLNRSKKSIGLDMSKPQSVEIVKMLIADYDIVVEQFRPGVMAKFGLDYENLKSVNPRLIYCSLTGYGQTGPYKNKAGHDINYLSIASIPEHSRRKTQRPVPSGIQVADVAGGSLHLVAGLLAAVIHRAETGKGQHVDISITDAVFTLNALPASDYLGAEVTTGPEQELLNGLDFYDYYETSDGRYFSVGGLEPKFLKNLCDVLEIPQVLKLAFSKDPRQKLEFKQYITNSIKTKTYAQCLSLFASTDACVEPVLTLSEACHNEHLLSRNMVVDVDGIKQIGCAVKMSGSEPVYNFKGCSLGEHNNLLVTEYGFSSDKMERLKRDEVFGKLQCRKV